MSYATDDPETGASLDELGEASFPASDPPQAWTWETREPPPAAPLTSEEKPGGEERPQK